MVLCVLVEERKAIDGAAHGRVVVWMLKVDTHERSFTICIFSAVKSRSNKKSNKLKSVMDFYA